MDTEHYWHESLDFILLTSDSSIAVISAFVAIGVLLLCSALISGSEVAFFSLKLKDIERIRKSAIPVDRLVIDLIDKPGILLATILIANNFINIAIIIISSFALGSITGGGIMPEWLSFLIDVVIVTFLLVLFGEISPKIYANLNNLKLARLMSRALLLLRRIFIAPSKLLVKSTGYIEQRLKKRRHADYTSLDEIVQAISLTVKDEKGTAYEENMLKGIIHLGNFSIKQLMCPRVDVIALDANLGFGEVMDIVVEENHSRIPVYEDSIDNIKGILYVKDLLAFLDKNHITFRWQSLIRQAHFVTEVSRVDDVLNHFKKERVHIAIVVDEYGGTAGIVTLEDILEEVIGEIKDEFDDDIEIKYSKLGENIYQFEGKTLLNDICRILKLNLNVFDDIRGDADSIAGLVLQLTQEIPETGTTVAHYPFEFIVKEAEARRIVEVVLTINNDTEEG